MQRHTNTHIILIVLQMQLYIIEKFNSLQHFHSHSKRNTFNIHAKPKPTK